MLNNPLKYNDPSGRATCDEEGNCYERGRRTTNFRTGSVKSFTFEEQFGISFEGNGWDEAHKNAVKAAVVMIGSQLAKGGGDPASAFRKAYGSGINFTWGNANASGDCADPDIDSGGCTSGGHQINFWTMSGDGSKDYDVIGRRIRNVVHELGHAYDNNLGRASRLDLATNHQEFIKHREDILNPNRIEGRKDWQQANFDEAHTDRETFADVFIAWTYDVWNPDPLNAEIVDEAQTWMSQWMP